MNNLLNKNKKELELQVQSQTQEFEQKISKFKLEEEDISNKIKDILDQIQKMDDETDRHNEEIRKSISKTEEIMAISYKQVEIINREEKISDAKFKTEETYLIDCQKEAQSKIEEIKKTQNKITSFLDQALDQYTKNGVFNFENLSL